MSHRAFPYSRSVARDPDWRGGNIVEGIIGLCLTSIAVTTANKEGQETSRHRHMH